MTDLYKLLLVDDEEDARQAVIRRLDWKSLGFEVVGEASNGEEALEMAERLEPDVIMTDIRMPYMDGLELCRRVKKLLPGTRMAILSGFDEFEYAREAITQQVEDYILKPIDAEALAVIFRRIRASLDEEIKRRRDIETLRRHYEESLPVIRRQALLELLLGNIPSAFLLEYLANRGLDIHAGGYCVAVIRYDGAAVEARFLGLSLEKLIEDTLRDGPDYFVLPVQGHVAILFLTAENTAPETISGVLHPLFVQGKKLLGLDLHIGIGKLYHRPEDVARSYEEAGEALEYQFLLEGGQCVCIGDIVPESGAERMPDPAFADAVIRQIKIGGEEDVRGAVRALVEHLKAVGTSPQQYQIYLMELLTGLLRVIRSYRIDEKEARLEALLSEGLPMRFGSLAELESWLYAYCDNLRRLARKERKDSIRMLVDRARDILECHYMDSHLSQDVVCAQLGVSTAYFSTVFKRETGEGFVGYLTNLRMEKALELLHTTDEKTYEITEKIGYTDPNYFSYVFKKRFGISPSRYRAAHGQAYEKV